MIGDANPRLNTRDDLRMSHIVGLPRPTRIVLRPRPIGVFLVCALTAAGGIYLFFRHDTVYDWLVGTLMLAASCLFVSGCLWRHYTVVTDEGVLHTDWWGFRRRYFPLKDISNVSGLERNVSMGILKPILQITIQTDNSQIRLTADIYSQSALQQALRIIDSRSPSISREVWERLKLG